VPLFISSIFLGWKSGGPPHDGNLVVEELMKNIQVRK